MHPDGVYNLIAAIINTAKKDYNKALKNDCPKSEYNSKASIEKFFNSEWLQFLTMGKANPEALIAQAKVGDYHVGF